MIIKKINDVELNKITGGAKVGGCSVKDALINTGTGILMGALTGPQGMIIGGGLGIGSCLIKPDTVHAPRNK